MPFFMARAFWLPLTTRTCNHTLIGFNFAFNPLDLYYLGVKNNNNGLFGIAATVGLI